MRLLAVDFEIDLRGFRVLEGGLFLYLVLRYVLLAP